MARILLNFDRKRGNYMAVDFENIATVLNELKNQYKDKNGDDLLVIGSRSFLNPNKYARLAESQKYERKKILEIGDESVIREIVHYLARGYRVIVIGRIMEMQIELYVKLITEQ